MEIMLIFWFLLVLVTARTEGLVSEEIMKIILESCYETENPSNPTVIFGDFDKAIDKVSIIRIDDSLNLEHYGLNQVLRFKASKIVLMENSLEKLALHLYSLTTTQLWDHMVPFFIVGQNTTSCENSMSILALMRIMKILNPVYICAKFINNTSALFTLNSITDYAPYPWESFQKVDDLNVYRQNFNSNITCTNLTYDKTKILNGYTITAVLWTELSEGFERGKNYFEEFTGQKFVNGRIMRALIVAMNTTGRFEIEIGLLSMINRYQQGAADIMLFGYTLDSFPGEPALFPHFTSDMIPVVKLGAEVSTLEKICRLWSTPVLIVAGVALVILFLILIMMNRNFGLALLDITRLLTYVDIRTDTNYQSFRIYFTTMLIFMVISNGVFQGKIAAFLTTRERRNPIKSISELIESGYKMYAGYGTSNYARKNCPKCEFKEVLVDECIQLVLNSTNNVCAMPKNEYVAGFIHLPLDYVEEAFNSEFEQFKCRRNWPLHNRMNNMMMQLIESGLINFWGSQSTSLPKAKRQATEAEWASAQYRPVQLPKLAFAFHLLAAGLSLSTIVFSLELLWTKLCNCYRSRHQSIQ